MMDRMRKKVGHRDILQLTEKIKAENERIDEKWIGL